MTLPILGGITAQNFLRHYWQKQPLLIRGAVPGFGDELTADELAGLACEEEAQARLVLQSRGRWQVEHGPFDEARFARLPKKNWTLLVQGVNHFLPEADALLRQFDFIPRARLDDVMVSFAPDGGGVGPHFDSYDVFLLQGRGRRRWRISGQDDRTLVEGAPLRILKNFHTEQEWLLEPGDMLYLPPRLAHWGIAEGDCMTWSIGFRAPTAQELAGQFLGHLQDTLQLDGMYADPDLVLQAHPAEIGDAMVGQVARMLAAIRWGEDDVARFLGSYLTEPKPHVLFSPARRMRLESFREKLRQRALQLDLKTQMLFRGDTVFVNGEALAVPAEALPWLVALADRRRLEPASALPDSVLDALRQWHAAGYLRFD